ncbi:MAG: sialidase family protein [Clostridiales bacterium]|nr:sialidase family protein [Clostridiales bacterium]
MKRMDGELKILSEVWDRITAVPYIVYMPEIGRLLILINCDLKETPWGMTCEGMLLYSDDHGVTWSDPQNIHKDENGNGDMGFCVGLRYAGNGKVLLFRTKTHAMNAPVEIWFSYDYGVTWTDIVHESVAPDNKPVIHWDPVHIDRDPSSGKETKYILASFMSFGTLYWGTHEGYSQGYYRTSVDSGRNWSEDMIVPQWKGVNEICITRAANGNLVAACRPDMQEEYKGKIDHFEGLGVSVSKDDGLTWTEVKRLYDFGRHHPSMVVLPDGRIVMSYVVRDGYEETADGFKQFGIEAVVSFDNGESWDMENRYILHKWPANRKDEFYYWNSSQSTSTVLLPDGRLLTAFGTAYRSSLKDRNINSPRDIGLVWWKP